MSAATGGAYSCLDVRRALGVYVLGAIDPAERAIVDRHLADCPGCREELAGLAGLPGLLSRLDLADVTLLADSEQPDAGLLDRVLAEAARRRAATRRRLLAAAAAAAVLIVAAVGGTAALVGRGGDSARPPAAAHLSATAGPVRAQVALVPRAWGTQVDLRLSGVASGQRCRLVALGPDGASDTAASWQATYAGAASVTGATALPLQAIRAVRVVGADGATLVTVPR